MKRRRTSRTLSGNRPTLARIFYIWAASGTDDSAYCETLVQVEAMARLTDAFPLSSLTFHEKDSARHEYRPMAEYLYNALPFFFPDKQNADMNANRHVTTSIRSET